MGGSGVIEGCARRGGAEEGDCGAWWPESKRFVPSGETKHAQRNPLRVEGYTIERPVYMIDVIDGELTLQYFVNFGAIWPAL